MERYITITQSYGQDGLGTPTVSLFLSYCDRKEKLGSFCKNCHNKDLQKDGVGYYLHIDDAIKRIEEKCNFFHLMFGKCAIAIMGGEPFSSLNIDYSYKIAEYFYKKNIQTIVYTWRIIEDIKKERINISPYNKIVCGSYIEELKVDDYKLGSTNQYVINNKFEKIIEYKK